MVCFGAAADATATKQINTISISVSIQNDRPVHRCAPEGDLQRVTISDAVLIQFDLLILGTTLLETSRGL